MEYELVPRYDTAKSFYRKAMVITDGNAIRLRSYSTIVAVIYRDEKTITYTSNDMYSRTTTRHQKEFFKQFGLNDEEVKEIVRGGSLVKDCE